jgi:hypothetical protein
MLSITEPETAQLAVNRLWISLHGGDEEFDYPLEPGAASLPVPAYVGQQLREYIDKTLANSGESVT